MTTTTTIEERHIFAKGGYGYAIGSPEHDHYWAWCYFGERPVIRTTATADRIEYWDEAS